MVNLITCVCLQWEMNMLTKCAGCCSLCCEGSGLLIKNAGDTRMPSRMHGQAARAVAEGNEDKAVDAFTRIIDYDRSFVQSIIYK